MARPPSVAERLDSALQHVLDGVEPAVAAASAGVAPPQRELVELAAELRSAVPAPPVAPRFEARLGARLAERAIHRDPLGWMARHHGHLIVTGAVGSAVGVGVTAYAVWRTARRAPGSPHRLIGR